MAFEKFRFPSQSFKPKISIRVNGQLGFSNGAVNRFDIKNYKYVVLYYDKENFTIGVKLINDENEEGASKLNFREKNIWVSAKSFFDFYKIDYAVSVAFDAEWNDEEKMITIKIQSRDNVKQKGGAIT